MHDDISGIRLVSWDVDGTLFSYFRALAALVRPVARHALSNGLARTARDIQETCKFHRIVEKQRRESDAAVVPAQLERFNATYALERRMLESALRAMRPRAGVLSLLGRFSTAGVPQVALSDFECDYKLKALGLRQYFASTYSCHGFGFWKPSPVSLVKIQADFGVHPSQHLHIGDRLDADGAACARNGCHFRLIDRMPGLWKAFNEHA